MGKFHACTKCGADAIDIADSVNFDPQKSGGWSSADIAESMTPLGPERVEYFATCRNGHQYAVTYVRGHAVSDRVLPGRPAPTPGAERE